MNYGWHWRRERNQNFGYWECACGWKSENVPVDSNGRPVSKPPAEHFHE